jgi:putative oxidoreductase
MERRSIRSLRLGVPFEAHEGRPVIAKALLMNLFRLLSKDRLFANPQIIAGLAPLPVRLIIGYGFVAHGWAKLSRGPDSFAVALQALGVPQPQLLSWLTTITELGGGAAVLAGVLIPLASLPLSVVLLTALFSLHYQYGFFSVKFAEVGPTGVKFGPVGYEIILLYMGGLAALAIGGPGWLSLDRPLRQWLGNRGA